LAAKFVGRHDLVKVWNLAAILLEGKETVYDTAPNWKQNPFGHKLVESLITHFQKQGDVQMLGMLACIFTEIHAPENHQENSQIKLARSSTDARSDSEATKPPPLPKQAEKRKIPPLLDPTKKDQFAHYQSMYSEILFRWGLLVRRAEVRKFLESSRKEQDAIYEVFCQWCRRLLIKTPKCSRCKRYGFSCAICHVAVKGLSVFCVACGHGGHSNHMKQWFSTNKECPTGCRCKCMEYGFFEE